jgi:hypothetical protein
MGLPSADLCSHGITHVSKDDIRTVSGDCDWLTVIGEGLGVFYCNRELCVCRTEVSSPPSHRGKLHAWKSNRENQPFADGR